jgi:hypothetical protein
MLSARACGLAQVDESRVRVYGLGSFFVPCEWNDYACHQAMVEEVLSSRIPETLAGYHQYSGSWLATVKDGGRRRLRGAGDHRTQSLFRQ